MEIKNLKHPLAIEVSEAYEEAIGNKGLLFNILQNKKLLEDSKLSKQKLEKGIQGWVDKIQNYKIIKQNYISAN